MPVMSANAQESTIAAAVGVHHAPDQPPPAPTVAPSPIPAAPPASTPVENEWRLAIVGYVLVFLGSVMVCVLPYFRIPIGLAESAVFLLGIVTVLGGAGVAMWSFIRPIFRRK
jgi:hypothetical protein